MSSERVIKDTNMGMMNIVFTDDINLIESNKYEDQLTIVVHNNLVLAIYNYKDEDGILNDIIFNHKYDGIYLSIKREFRYIDSNDILVDKISCVNKGKLLDNNLSSIFSYIENPNNISKILTQFDSIGERYHFIIYDHMAFILNNNGIIQKYINFIDPYYVECLDDNYRVTINSNIKDTEYIKFIYKTKQDYMNDKSDILSINLIFDNKTKMIMYKIYSYKEINKYNNRVSEFVEKYTRVEFKYHSKDKFILDIYSSNKIMTSYNLIVFNNQLDCINLDYIINCMIERYKEYMI